MISSLDLQNGKPLREVSTFGIGGPARYYVEVKDSEQLRQALAHCKHHGLPYFILGKGSNCLFDDRGFNGLVIHNKIDFLKSEIASDHAVFTVGAGYSFSLLGVQTARQGWSGLEFASGIPGSVGGAVFMNAGANGQETSRCLTSVEFLGENGDITEFKRSDLPFSYRTSPFQTMPGAILSAAFTLSPSVEARKQQIDIIHYRKKTQPLTEKSAGCVFRNPSGGSAGALIDQMGLKGQRIGGAQVSSVHANFLVNAGDATAVDMLKLIDLIKSKAQEIGVNLEEEIRYIPYRGGDHGFSG